MATRKLDMGAAWSGATALIAQNKDTVSAIAGLFFFLPYLAVGLLAPDMASPETPEIAPGASPDAAMQAMLEQLSNAYADNWPLFMGATVVQFIGSLALLALLSNRDRPSVGEAIKRGFGAAPSYFLAQVLSALLIGVIIGLPLGLSVATGSGVVAALLVPVLLMVALYIFVKFALLAPVIAIEGLRNPIAALQRSWRLTKGNSFRIVLFLVLLFLTIGIIAVLFSLVLGLVFALFDETVANIGNAVVASLVNTLFAVVGLLVLASVHRQLAGPSGEQLAATFE
ncbi:MAG: hypothetical protein ABS49_10845 [Erythrobacter sp. SCN 62-14]|nr:MAG: hypothetical protein ABS49_10845 [Erythrobacter sp. SCN 62-14]